MKKKIIALAVVVVLVCGVVAGSLISCNIVTNKAVKDYNQVEGTLYYGGLTEQVFKGALPTHYSTYESPVEQCYTQTEDEAP